MAADWQTLTKPFAKRVRGHNQVTDACLREGLILTTFDKAILHLAGEHKQGPRARSQVSSGRTFAEPRPICQYNATWQY